MKPVFGRRNMTTDKRLLVKIAHYYYRQNLTQEQIAQKLGMSRQKVNRLFKRLMEEGVVAIQINDFDYNIQLESRLEERYGLKQAIVVSSALADEEITDRLGKAGAKYLEEVVTDGSIISVAWGRALHNVAQQLSVGSRKNVSVVQLAGGMTHANISVQLDEVYQQSGEITRLLAGKLNATPYYMNGPIFVENENITKSLMQEPSIKNSFQMIRKSDIAVIGIGGVSQHVTPFRYGHLPHSELEELKQGGAVGNLCFRYFDIDGKPVITSLDKRIIGSSLEELVDIPLLVGIAGGSEKHEAILGALRGRFLDVLITDYDTAMEVLDVQGKDKK
jgi:deoxyribonucleoside regulator